MTDGTIKSKVASLFVDMFYDRLRLLYFNGMEGTDEYVQMLQKLKHCVDVENEEYHKLTDDEILDGLVECKAEDRRHSKLSYEMRSRSGSIGHDGLLLGDVVVTKMIIDIIKTTDENLKALELNGFDEEDMGMVMLYHRVSVFTRLTINNFIEELALKYDFDISKIPVIQFDEISEGFNINFIKDTIPMFLKYAKDGIDELFHIEEENKYACAYSLILGLSKIESILTYLDRKSVYELQNYIDDNYRDDDTKGAIKALIRKRKEELN